MGISNVFNQILILFLILITGIIAKKLNAVSERLSTDLSSLILNISLPAFIISSMRFDFSMDILLKSGKMLLLSLIIQVLSIPIAIFITKLLKIQGKKKNVFEYMLIFANVGYIGYPITSALYGAQGVFYTSLYNVTFNILNWTFGITIMDDKKESKISFKRLINPGIIATIIGFIIFVFSIKIPGPIESAIEMIGNVTTPLSMLVIGFTLGEFSIKQAFSDYMVFIMSVFRLIIIPVFFLLVLKMFVADKIILGVAVTLAAMPAAATTAIFASKFESEAYTASQCIFVSTSLSLVTIPIITYLIKMIL